MPPPSPFGPSQPLPGDPAAPALRPGYPAAPGSPPGYPAAPGSPPGYPAAPGSPPGYPAAPGSPPGYPAAPGPPAGYALPAQYYAGPEDPLVSRDIGGWWNRSLRLLQKAWLPLLAVHLISVPALEVLTAWAQTAINGKDELSTSDVRTFLLRLGLTVLVGGLLSAVVSLASLRMLVQAATGRPIAIGAALLDALRRTPLLIGWGIPAVLMVGLGLV